MQKYSDVVLDTLGNVVAGATVTVALYPSGTAATVYSSNAIGANANPLTTDSTGRFTFYAPNGRYQLTVAKSGLTSSTLTDIVIHDLFVNVMEFGAKVDGTTNDLAAIQAAIDAVNAAGGGTVFIPPGTMGVTCNSQGIQFRDNVHIMGAGRGVTTVKLLAGSTLTSSHGIFEPLGYPTAPAVGYCSKNNTISRLSIDGNKANNAGTFECIAAAFVKNFFCEDVEGFGASEAAFHGQRHSLGSDLNSNVAFVGCVGHDSVEGFQVQGAIVDDCYAYSNSIGFHCAGNYSGGGTLTNIVTRFSNCEATGNTSAGFVHDLQAGSGIKSLFENCVAHSNSGVGGFSINAMNDVALVNCSARANTGATVDGLFIAGDRVSVIGGHYSDNGRDGINLSGNRTRILISGVIATSNGAFGINIGAPNGGADNLITDCILSGNTSGAISVFTAQTYRLINNIGLNPIGAFGFFGNPANPAVPASTGSVTNNYGFPVLITIAGGTVTAVAIQSINTGLTTPASIHLPPGLAVTLTYTVAPTWQWYGL